MPQMGGADTKKGWRPPRTRSIRKNPETSWNCGELEVSRELPLRAKLEVRFQLMDLVGAASSPRPS